MLPEAISAPPEIIEKKLSIIRRYIMECVIIVLSTAVVFLFNKVSATDKMIINFYKEDHNRALQILQSNNNVIENNNVLMITIKQVINEQEHQIRQNKFDKDTAGLLP